MAIQFPQMSGTGLILATALVLSSCATKTMAVRAPAQAPSSYTRQAVNASDAGDGDLEIASLRHAMMSHPDDIEARLRLAQAYATRGFADVALEHYRLTAQRFPESMRAAVRVSCALRQAEQPQEALAGLKAFIKAHPQKAAEPYEWLGILNDDLQQWKESQLAYETALLYSPQSAGLHNNLGYSLLMQNLNSAAAGEFRAALRISRDLVIARNNLGIALADGKGESREAILNWQAVGGPAAAHNNMAALMIERGDFAGARKELDTALGFDRRNAQALYNLALVSEKDGKPGVVPVQKANTAAAKRSNWLLSLFHSNRKAEAGSPEPIATRTTPAGSGN